MNPRNRALRFLGAAAVICTLTAACTQPGPQQPSPSPTPTPAPSRSTPTETQLERETRLAFSGAERAYRTNMAEQDRVFGPGVAKKVTQVLKNTSADHYLDQLAYGLSEARKNNWFTSASTIIVSVSADAYKGATVVLTTCEDNRKVLLVYPDGKKVKPAGTRLYVQKLTVKKFGEVWKVSDLSTDQVKTFQGDSRCMP